VPRWGGRGSAPRRRRCRRTRRRDQAAPSAAPPGPRTFSPARARGSLGNAPKAARSRGWRAPWRRAPHRPERLEHVALGVLLQLVVIHAQRRWILKWRTNPRLVERQVRRRVHVQRIHDGRMNESARVHACAAHPQKDVLHVRTVPAEVASAGETILGKQVTLHDMFQGLSCAAAVREREQAERNRTCRRGRAPSS
jgi:hypothetical protein